MSTHLCICVGLCIFYGVSSAYSLPNKARATFMPETLKVFVSAVSEELGNARRAVRDTLTTKGILPVVQDNFPPDYRTVKDILRTAIAECHAVLCLVGQQYGREPKNRDDHEPRRSYTQLEYEIAVELGKPIILFIYRGAPEILVETPQSDELKFLQLAYLQRLSETDQVRQSFKNQQELCEQVALIDFSINEIHRTIATLLQATIDHPESAANLEKWISEIAQPWQTIVSEINSKYGGRVHEESSGKCVLQFPNAVAAVNAALAIQHLVEQKKWPITFACRIGIHSGEILQFRGVSLSNALKVSHATDFCHSLNELSGPGQILMSRAAFDEARQSVQQHPEFDDSKSLLWVSHGHFLFRSNGSESDQVDESFEVCEVGLSITRPADTANIVSSDSLEQERMRGWRPSIGQPIPTRENWLIQEKIGEGGFGEVWLARDPATNLRRVFKFCFDADRLRSFQRELTVFRLLREELGDRNDIAKLGQVQLDQAPYFLDSEYVEAGNLIDWSENQGGIGTLPMDDRIRIMRQICSAVAAAHSVGVFHRDLKPSNIFMRQDASGTWHPMLADFGIGALANRTLLDLHKIPHASLMQSMLVGSVKGSGTLMYRPPELESGSQRATTQADVYALGVILFQMVSGNFNRPAGIGWEELLQQVPDDSSNLEYDTKIQILRQDIRDSIHADPDSRLSSAAELATRLETLPQRAEAESARLETDRIQKRNRRLRNSLTIATGLLLIVGGLSVLSVVQWQKAISATERERTSNENLRKINHILETANKKIIRQNEQIGNLNTSLSRKVNEITQERDKKELQRRLAQKHLYEFQLGNAEQAALRDNVPAQLAWLRSAISVAGNDISSHERENTRERLALAEARLPILEKTIHAMAPCIRVKTDLNGRFVAVYSRDLPTYGPVIYNVDSGERVLGPLANHNASPAQFIALDDAGLKLAYVYGSEIKKTSTLELWDLQTALPIGSPIELEGEVSAVWFSSGFGLDVHIVTVKEEAKGNDETQVNSSEVFAYKVTSEGRGRTSFHSLSSAGEVFRLHKSLSGGAALIAFMDTTNRQNPFIWHYIGFSAVISSKELPALKGREVASFAGGGNELIASVDSSGRLYLQNKGEPIETQVSLPANTSHLANIESRSGFCLIAAPGSINTSSQLLSQTDSTTNLYVISGENGPSGEIRSHPIQVSGFPTSYTSLRASSIFGTEYMIGTNSGHVYFGNTQEAIDIGSFLPVHHNSPIIAVQGLGRGHRVISASENGNISIWSLDKSELRRSAASRIERLQLEPQATTMMWAGIRLPESQLNRLDVFSTLSTEALYLHRDHKNKVSTIVRGNSVDAATNGHRMLLPANFIPYSGVAISNNLSLLFDSAAIPRHARELLSIGIRQTRPKLIPKLLRLTYRGNDQGLVAICNHETDETLLLTESLPGPPLKYWVPKENIAVIAGNSFDGASGFVAKIVAGKNGVTIKVLKTSSLLDVAGNGNFIWAIDSHSQLIRIDAHKDVPQLSGSPKLGSLYGLAVSSDGSQVIAWSEDELFSSKFDDNKFIKYTSDIGSLWDLKFSPDGKTIVAHSQDDLLAVLDSQTLETISTIQSEFEIEALAISPDGQSVVVAEETPFLSDKGRQRTLGFSMDRRRRLRHLTLPDLREIVPDVSQINSLPIRTVTIDDTKWATMGSLLYHVPVRHLQWSSSGQEIFVIQGRHAQITSPHYAPSTITTIPIGTFRTRDLPHQSYGIQIDPATLELSQVTRDSTVNANSLRYMRLLKSLDEASDLSGDDVSFLTAELIKTRNLSDCWKVADHLYYKRRFTEALKIYVAAYQLNKKSLPNAIRYARCLNTCYPDQAAHILDVSIKTESNSFAFRNDGYVHSAHAILADSYALLGQWQKAAEEFDKHIEVPMFRRMLGDSDTATNVLNRATYVALRTSQYTKAQRYVELMLSLARDSDDPAAWAKLTEHFSILRAQISDDELYRVQKLLKNKRPDTSGRILLAVEFTERGMLDDAEKLLDELQLSIEKNPSISRLQPKYLLLAAQSLLAAKRGVLSEASRLRNQCHEAWKLRLSESKYNRLPSYTYAEILNRLVGTDSQGIAVQAQIPEMESSSLEPVSIQSPELVGNSIFDVAIHYFNKSEYVIAAESCEQGIAAVPFSQKTADIREKLQLLWARARIGQLLE